MDDVLLFSDTLEGLKKELEIYLDMCKKKTVGKQTVFCVLPKNSHIQAFQNLKKPKTKHDVRVFYDMLASLQTLNQSIPLRAKLLRAAAGARGKKFVWTEDMENEYNKIREIMKKQLKLTPYDPGKKLRLW